MIYFISDLHGEGDVRALKRYEKVRKDGDMLIILGDVGVKFDKNSEENACFDKYFLALDYPTLIVDGNHENFDYLYSFPREKTYGGEVHRLTDNIVYLRRGEIFNLEGKTFFVMGGCKSSAKWKEMGLWFEGEEPTEVELSLAYNNLQKCQNQVDYVLTHKYVDYKKDVESKFQALSLEGLTKYIDENVTFRHWYSGHWHINKVIDENHTIVYDELIQLA